MVSREESEEGAHFITGMTMKGAGRRSDEVSGESAFECQSSASQAHNHSFLHGVVEVHDKTDGDVAGEASSNDEEDSTMPMEAQMSVLGGDNNSSMALEKENGVPTDSGPRTNLRKWKRQARGSGVAGDGIEKGNRRARTRKFVEGAEGMDGGEHKRKSRKEVRQYAESEYLLVEAVEQPHQAQ